MKRLASIFFLLVFLFNVGGYYIVFWGIEKQAKQNLLSRLDANDYASNETVILTMPISLPYPIHQQGYERVNGEFEYQGEYFKLVKQKLENDTLYLVCIKDITAKKIAVAMADYSKLANNIPAGTKQALNFLSKLFKDFSTPNSIHFLASSSNLKIERGTLAELSPLEIHYPVDSPPPELFM